MSLQKFLNQNLKKEKKQRQRVLVNSGENVM